MNYNQIIRKLITLNNVSQINLLHYDNLTSLEIDWLNKKKFLRNLKIWTTSYPSKRRDMLALEVGDLNTFSLKNYLREGKVLGLHSTLLDRNKNQRYWLMLDLNARPDRNNLQKIGMYVSCLLELLNIKGGGYILETDRSYHFIGKKIVTAKTFKNFIECVIKSNGGNGLADVGFCGHTLAKSLDVCLRIQMRKGGKELKVVKILK